MDLELQDVNQFGFSDPSLDSSSRETDNNISTQEDQGDVINTDQKDSDEIDYKNKFFEEKRKRELAEEKLNFANELTRKIQPYKVEESRKEIPLKTNPFTLSESQLIELEASSDGASYLNELYSFPLVISLNNRTTSITEARLQV